MSEINKEISSLEELEKYQKESKIYEVDFKGKIFIREILSREEFQKEFDKYIKNILYQLEKDYYLTGAKFSNADKFHRIKSTKKYNNLRVILTKATKIIKLRKANKLVKMGVIGFSEEREENLRALYMRHKIQNSKNKRK